MLLANQFEDKGKTYLFTLTFQYFLILFYFFMFIHGIDKGAFLV